MIESKYMEFDKIGDTGKTETWNVLSKKSEYILGKIKWYGPWRQYSFFPSPMSIFNNSCMSDIQNFIKELMEKRKEDNCPCKGTGLIPAPDGEAICRKHFNPSSEGE